MHVLAIDGHRYSVDHAAPRLVLMSVMETTQRSVRAGRDASHFDAHGRFATVLADQQQGVHRITAGACACGLVVDDVRELGGHRDLDTICVARTFVVADHDGWWAMACQSCRVVSACGSADLAHRRVRDHLCAWDVAQM